MSVNNRTDDLASAVRYALETTRANPICPFHENVIIRVGDDDAEKHAYLRACNIVKSDGILALLMGSPTRCPPDTPA